METNLQIFTEHVEPQAVNQIYEIVKSPAMSGASIRIMPDVHQGKGCVIGFTAKDFAHVIPNLIGVDISCGMLTMKVEETDIDLEKLDMVISCHVPAGHEVSEVVDPVGEHLIEQLRCRKELRNKDHLLRSIGSLGGGNHFIELDKEEETGIYYLIIHTGSRNLGKQVAEIYQKKAVAYVRSCSDERQKLIAKYKAAGRERELEGVLKAMKTPKVPEDLCWLSDADRDDYYHDMKLLEMFAFRNRQMIMKTICQQMGWEIGNFFETVHNYIDFSDEGHPVIRKGAISAKEGESVLIPLNMRDGCILGVGKGNPDWNESAPHGAGRAMSRSQAKELISIEDFQKSMTGIYSSSVTTATLDESPFAYKSKDWILETLSETVEIVSVLKPVYNFKAH
jgi:RNA-splicing ligase RtcB